VALTTSYPGEIEEILSERLAVRGAAVVGIAHPEFGEDVGAAVALKAGAGVTGDGIRDQFRTTVDSYECSQATSFVDELPKARVAHAAGGDDGEDRLVNG
jgi:long-chain acyl-CoA synthetase